MFLDLFDLYMLGVSGLMSHVDLMDVWYQLDGTPLMCRLLELDFARVA